MISASISIEISWLKGYSSFGLGPHQFNSSTALLRCPMSNTPNLINACLVCARVSKWNKIAKQFFLHFSLSIIKLNTLLPTFPFKFVFPVLLSLWISMRGSSLCFFVWSDFDPDLDPPGYSAYPCEDPDPSAGRKKLGSGCHRPAETPSQGEDSLEGKGKAGDKIFFGFVSVLVWRRWSFADTALQKQTAEGLKTLSVVSLSKQTHGWSNKRSQQFLLCGLSLIMLGQFCGSLEALS